MTLKVIRGSDLLRAMDLVARAGELRARVVAEIDRDPAELPDEAIVPDETPPNPPDDIRTDPVPEDDPTTQPVDPEEGA